MADIFTPGYTSPNSFSAEMGNAFIMTMEAATAANSTDKIYMGILPAGVRIDFVRGNFADTGTGNTLSVGYEPMDGTTPSAALTYWWSALDTATAAVPAAISGAAPVRFDKPVKVVITVNTQNLTGTPSLRLTFMGDMIGAR
jgi:hypothetical protein